MKAYFFRHRAWLWPLIAMGLITPFTPALDMALTHHAFESSQPPGFHSSPFATFMYEYGLIPGQLLFITSGIMLFLSCFFKRWRRWYPASLILVLTLAIGSGLITHGILKDHWGRPRPKQVIEFGGSQPFRPYYKPNFFTKPEPSKSFACGHCSMGFYFFALALVGRRYNMQWLFISALAIALALGVALSIARIQQGGHFLSDTLASALIMWLTAYTCNYWIKDDERIN
ncbi:MAG: phosphatase PAP2 family protein [Parachlamydiaceae bacterium]